ncbi:phosphoribosylamine--glycine ligase [Spirochaetia bacterium]|nr:phosphoribosylamine--glycine ligase [Spirochaetia bacterium]
MNVLVIGSGGREHAIAWKLSQSPKVDRVLVAPGNGGTAGEAKCENVAVSTGEELLALSRRKKIGLCVVGPEGPLAEGIVDLFRREKIAIIGPDKNAARLESSKLFAKAFMTQDGVKTAHSHHFSDCDAALHAAAKHFERQVSSLSSGRKPEPALPVAPLVIKADGLAAGKGVVVASNPEEAQNAIRSFMKDRSLGDAGKTVLLEDFISGREVSVLAAVSAFPGKKGFIAPFVAARDHKRRFEGGKGPNTGGMGAVAPLEDFTGAAHSDFIHHILEPTLRGIEQEKFDYRGFLFFGLMVNDHESYLLEYNVRLGDPETQAVLPLLESDFAELCLAIHNGTLGGNSAASAVASGAAQNSAASPFQITWKNGFVCAPVAAASGYPGEYRKGDPISIDAGTLDRYGAKYFAAGVGASDGGLSAGDALVTSGGRVLSVSAWGADFGTARKNAYSALEGIHFDGMVYRTDIGIERI